MSQQPSRAPPEGSPLAPGALGTPGAAETDEESRSQMRMSMLLFVLLLLLFLLLLCSLLQLSLFMFTLSLLSCSLSLPFLSLPRNDLVKSKTVQAPSSLFETMTFVVESPAKHQEKLRSLLLIRRPGAARPWH